MGSDTYQPEWFRQWFNNDYKSIYSHRHSQQASHQVNAILKLGVIPLNAKILDVACGTGRHMFRFKKLKLRTYGIDLSLPFLYDARTASLPVVQADMRALPFQEEKFDLVTCFFSSSRRT